MHVHLTGGVLPTNLIPTILNIIRSALFGRELGHKLCVPLIRCNRSRSLVEIVIVPPILSCGADDFKGFYFVRTLSQTFVKNAATHAINVATISASDSRNYVFSGYTDVWSHARCHRLSRLYGVSMNLGNGFMQKLLQLQYAMLNKTVNKNSNERIPCILTKIK